MCAQIKRERWNVGKKTDTPEFDYHGKKTILMGKATLLDSRGQTGPCTGVFARVTGKSCAVCRPAEA